MLIAGIVIYLLGAGYDAYTTKRAVVDNPTLFREANRFIAPLVNRFGIVGITLAKLVPLAVLLPLAHAIDAGTQVGVGLIVLGAWFGRTGFKNARLFRRVLR